MGQFLSMSGVVGVDERSVLNALRSYAEEKAGQLEQAHLTTEDDGCLVISQGSSGVSVLYPFDFFDWDGAAEFLSRRLEGSVFSFHIHDGDLWMYSLYDNGNIVDRFNPVPDYWQVVEEEKRRSWQGNAAEVARRIPGLTPEQISRYLVQWGSEVLEGGERKKAYPTDGFYYGDDWQLVDFLEKLGLDYPIDDHGVIHGATYRFRCHSV